MYGGTAWYGTIRLLCSELVIDGGTGGELASASSEGHRLRGGLQFSFVALHIFQFLLVVQTFPEEEKTATHDFMF